MVLLRPLRLLQRLGEPLSILLHKHTLCTKTRPASVAASEVLVAPFNSELIVLSLLKPAPENSTTLLTLQPMTLCVYVFVHTLVVLNCEIRGHGKFSISLYLLTFVMRRERQQPTEKPR